MMHIVDVGFICSIMLFIKLITYKLYYIITYISME